MEILLFVLTVFYVIIIFWLTTGVYRLRKTENDNPAKLSQPSVSIVVAARNEENTIQSCVEALLRQEYPKEKFEVIIVNDRSEDRTGEIVKTYQKTHQNLKFVEIKEIPEDYKSSPKKYALTCGITSSKGEIICTTDADCFPSQKWINEMVRQFDDNVGFVIGHSPFQGNGFFNRLIQLEELSYVAVSAGGIGMGYPSRSVGRNLAYRRKAFNEVDGFSNVKQFAPGDDNLLMALIRDKTQWNFRFVFSKNSHVNTEPPYSFKQALLQRIRWSSLGAHFSLPITATLAAVFFFNLFLLITVPLFFLGSGFSILPLFSYGIKTVSEFLLIYQTALLVGEQYLMLYFPIAALFHIPYLVLFGVWGTFGKVQWKN